MLVLKTDESFSCADFMTLLPRRGVLKASEQEMISITFHPKLANTSVTMKTICEIEGGLDHNLILSGSVSEISYVLSENFCDFGRQVCEI